MDFSLVPVWQSQSPPFLLSPAFAQHPKPAPVPVHIVNIETDNLSASRKNANDTALTSVRAGFAQP
jgi:hypothetical protein